MRFQIIITLTVLLFGIINPGFSQGVNLNAIEEFRYNGSKESLLRLKMEVDNFEEDGLHFLRVQKVNSALDNTGKSLGWHSSYPNEGQWSRSRYVNFNLQAPSRDATSIEKLSAVIQHFSVSKEKNSLLSIENLLQKKEVNFLSHLDKEAKLILLDFETLKELRGQSGYKPYIEKLHENLDIGSALEEAERFVETLFYFSYEDKGSHLFFYKKDPKNKIFRFYIFNGKGEKINTGYSYAHEKIVVYLAEAPDENTRLEIMYEHPDALDKVELDLKNIPLP
ncbi:hypothetical protein [Zunongwangia sp. HGR-M22]|uniref:hypothetical protein n=1 Tax=Zunongwangia sp. HGR-M22 TaxID=3015168 RepID=UPI0022DE1983|nr:hypothetical protein [Zunongwangia sp. HGR-M22]WBL26551.1 hypothetical protein PBT91_04585 [Zunongwangia sp. HGR-M22]